jgi:hypothetical protein
MFLSAFGGFSKKAKPGQRLCLRPRHLLDRPCASTSYRPAEQVRPAACVNLSPPIRVAEEVPLDYASEAAP